MNNISKEKAREISEAQVPLRIRDHRLRVDRIKRNAQRRKVAIDGEQQALFLPPVPNLGSA
jgi:hypothetical protein